MKIFVYVDSHIKIDTIMNLCIVSKISTSKVLFTMNTYIDDDKIIPGYIQINVVTGHRGRAGSCGFTPSLSPLSSVSGLTGLRHYSCRATANPIALSLSGSVELLM